MSLSDLGAIGDFVAAIGVLVTLGYLTYQTRQTNRLLAQSKDAQTAAMIQANIGLWQNLYGKILESADAARVFKNLREGRDSNPDDHERFEALLVMWVLALENLTFQSKLNPFVDNVDGVLDHIYRQNVSMFMRSGAALLWWTSARRLFGPEVVKRIDVALQAEGLGADRSDQVLAGAS